MSVLLITEQTSILPVPIENTHRRPFKGVPNRRFSRIFFLLAYTGKPAVAVSEVSVSAPCKDGSQFRVTVGETRTCIVLDCLIKHYIIYYDERRSSADMNINDVYREFYL